VILAKNAILRERLEAIRREFPREETVVLAVEMAAHAKYYLRDYRVIDAEFERGERVFGPGLAEQERRARRAVIFDFKTVQYAADPRALWELPLPSGMSMLVLAIPEGYVLHQEPGRFWLAPRGG